MKIKTEELTGNALDWAVAKCEEPSGRDNAEQFLRDHRIGFTTRYSANWSQGGPIIEREKIRLVFRDLGEASYWCAEAHEAYQGDQYIDGKGPTPLIAAMRCYVASRLGEEVEVPEELV